jgi:hypothetical protein
MYELRLVQDWQKAFIALRGISKTRGYIPSCELVGDNECSSLIWVTLLPVPFAQVADIMKRIRLLSEEKAHSGASEMIRHTRYWESCFG